MGHSEHCSVMVADMRLREQADKNAEMGRKAGG